MSQVKIYQEGGKTPNTGQKYTFKIDGDKLFDLGHEELQTWFDGHMKAGKGKTKNRDEWNGDFNNFLNGVKEANSKGQYYDLDIQGDSVGAIAAPSNVNNAQQGLREDGSVAKPGFGAGITGVKDDTARNSSIVGGVADYVKRAYKNTTAINDKAKLEADNKAKSEADKAKADGLSKYTADLDGYAGKYLSPTAAFTNADGTQASNEYALKRYHTSNKAGQSQILSQWGNGAAGALKSLYDQAQLNPEYKKLFDSKYKDASTRLTGYGTSAFNPSKFLRGANAENYDMFTDAKSWQTLQSAQQAAAPKAPLMANPNGTFKGLDGKSYVDKEGTTLANGDTSEGTLINGVLAQGNVKGLEYRHGKLLDGDEGDLRYAQGKLYTGQDAVAGENNTYKDAKTGMAYDRQNYRNMPFRLNGKLTDFNTYARTIGSDYSKYGEQAEKFKNILALGKLDTSSWMEGNPDIDRNEYDPYNGITDKLPKYYNNLTGNFSGLSPKKGSLIEEYNGEQDEFGGAKTTMWYRRAEGGRIQVQKLLPDAFGRTTMLLANGERVPIGVHSNTPKDLSKEKYNYGGKKPKTKDSGNFEGDYSGFMAEGGRLEKLKALKFQFGGSVGYRPAGSDGKEKYHEVGAPDVFGSDYKLTTTDKLQLGALAADIGSLALTVAPGVGNVAAAGVGAAGTIANLGANISKDGSDWGDWGTAAAGLGLDALTLLPGAGSLAKTSKIAMMIKKSAPLIGVALAGAGLYSAKDSLQKILSGEGTINDYKQVTTGLTGAIAGKRIATDKLLATTKGATQASIKVGDELHDVTPEFVTQLGNLKGDAKSALVREFVANKKTAQSADDFAKGLIDEAQVVDPNSIQLDKGFGLKYKGISVGGKDKIKVNEKAGEDSLRPITEETGYLRKRAIKRYAMANPNIGGAEEVLGNDNRLPSLFGQKYKKNPFSTLRQDAPVTPAEESIVDDVADVAADVKPATVNTKPIVANEEPGSVTDNAKVAPVEVNDELAKTKADTEQLLTDFTNKKPRASAPSEKTVPYTPQATKVDPSKTVELKGLPKAEKIKAAQEAAVVKPEEGSTSTESDAKKIKDSSNKLMNLYLSRKPAPSVDNKTITHTATSTPTDPSKIVSFSDAAKKQQSKVADAQETVKSTVQAKVGDDTKLRALRKSLGLATGKEHELSIDKIFSPVKGSKDEAISKKILGNKKLAAQLEAAIDNGQTTIKLAKGGILKAQGGYKLPYKPNKALLNWNKPIGIFANDLNPVGPSIDDQAKAFTTKFTTGIGAVLGVPKATVPNALSPVVKDYVPGQEHTTSLGEGDSTGVAKGGFNLKSLLSGVSTNTLSELGRALYNRNLASKVDTRVEAPMSMAPAEVSVPVKGDLLTQSAYNNSAARIQQGAGITRTSDSMLNTAGQLSANKQAEDIRLQGAGANSEAITKSEQMNTQNQMQNAQVRAQVANQNNASLANKTQAERQMKNAQMNAMGKSIDNFWASQDQQNATDDRVNKMYDGEINALDAQTKFGGPARQVYADYESAQNEATMASKSGDKVRFDAANAKLADLKAKGDRLGINMKRMNLEFQRNPNFQLPNDFDITKDWPSVNNSVQARRSQFIAYRASGGKLSVEDKMAIQEYKDQNKAYSQDTKEYNKWLSLRTREDNKVQTGVGKSIDSLIKQALKFK